MRKLISLVLTFVLVISIVSSSVIAGEITQFTENENPNYEKLYTIKRNNTGTYNFYEPIPGSGKYDLQMFSTGNNGVQAGARIYPFGEKITYTPGEDDKFVEVNAHIVLNEDFYTSVSIAPDSASYKTIKDSDFDLKILYDLKNKKMQMYYDGTGLGVQDISSDNPLSNFQTRFGYLYSLDHYVDSKDGADGNCDHCGKPEAQHVDLGSGTVLMSVSDISAKEYTSKNPNATLDDFIAYINPALPAISERDGAYVDITGKNGNYTMKYMANTLTTPKYQTSFWISMVKEGVLKNGIVDESIKYVKLDFTLMSDYEIKSLAINNKAASQSDANITCGSNTVNISIVWDVLKDWYYIYKDDILAGIKMDLDMSSNSSGYEFGIKVNYPQDTIGGKNDIVLGTITNLKQTCYDKDTVLSDMNLYTTTANYADNTYTIKYSLSDLGVVKGTTRLNTYARDVYYAGYDRNGEFLFITLNNGMADVSVSSAEKAEYIQAFVWQSSNQAPLMRAEGLIKVIE